MLHDGAGREAPSAEDRRLLGESMRVRGLMVSLFATTLVASSYPAVRAQVAAPVATGRERTAAGRGVDLSGMDRSVAPGDDFYAFANGAWMRATEIPPDRAGIGSFDVLNDVALQQTRELLEQAAKTAESADADTRRVGDFYASYMDEQGIDAKGLAPLQPQRDAIRSIADRRDLARVLGANLRADVDPLNATNFWTDRLFGLWVGPAFSNPSRYTPYLLQGGLGMPDRDYYLAGVPQMARLRTAYRQHVVAIFKLLGAEEPEGRADAVFALERKIAATHADRGASQDVAKANNPWNREEFTTRAPGLDWPTYLRGRRSFRPAHVHRVASGSDQGRIRARRH